MGRKTFESIGRPLPKRTNFVISRTLKEISGVQVFESLDAAVKSAEEINKLEGKENEIVIIGGGYLFRDTIETVNKLLITRVDCDIEGDIFYPDIDLTEWKLCNKVSFRKDKENDYNFEIEEYSKL